MARFHGLTIASSTCAKNSRAALEGMLCRLAGSLDTVRAVGVDERRIPAVFRSDHTGDASHHAHEG